MGDDKDSEVSKQSVIKLNEEVNRVLNGYFEVDGNLSLDEIVEINSLEDKDLALLDKNILKSLSTFADREIIIYNDRIWDIDGIQ
jgi:hypothetical protein